MEALRQHFRPEFLNRVDEIVVFHSLSRADLARIVDIQVEHLERLLADRKLTLVLTTAARDFLADKGYDPAFGARPLKRAIQRHLQDPLALAVLNGEFRAGDTIHVGVSGDRLVFERTPGETGGDGAAPPEPVVVEGEIVD